MLNELDSIVQLLERATPGEWYACNKGGCPCNLLWCPDHPVAEVIRGEWGDTYPAIRLIDGEGMSGTKAEAYLERMTYGEVSDEAATANAKLIIAAVNFLRTHVTELQGLVRDAERYRWLVASGKYVPSVGPSKGWGIAIGSRSYAEKSDLDQAIDAAIAGGKL